MDPLSGYFIMVNYKTDMILYYSFTYIKEEKLVKKEKKVFTKSHIIWNQ